MKAIPESEFEMFDEEDMHPYPPVQNVTPTTARLRIIDPTLWEGVPVPPREWIVEDFIPANTVSLLTGEGSAGKSTLALQLAVARGVGKAWLNTMPKAGPTLILSAEDDADEAPPPPRCNPPALRCSLR